MGYPVDILGRLAKAVNRGPTKHRHPTAPARIPVVLGIEVPTWAAGRRKVSKEIRDLIRQMSQDNPLWGASRIHGELFKLGIKVSQATA